MRVQTEWRLSLRDHGLRQCHEKGRNPSLRGDYAQRSQRVIAGSGMQRSSEARFQQFLPAIQRALVTALILLIILSVSNSRRVLESVRQYLDLRSA